MFWLLLLISLGIGSVYYKWHRRKLYKIHEDLHVNFVKTHPILGIAPLLVNNEADQEIWFKYLGRLVIKQKLPAGAFWVVNKTYIFVVDPETAEVVLKSCIDKAYLTRFLQSVIGNGSIFASVKIWRPRRKVLAPIFSMKNLNNFVTAFNKQSLIMTRLLEPMAGGSDFSIWRYFTTYTFDSVCETTMGIDLSSQKNPNHSFLVAFNYLSAVIAERMVTPWLYPDVIFQLRPSFKQFVYHRNNIYNFIDGLIRQKRQDLAAIQQVYDKNSNEDEVKTFLELMIESSERLEKGYTDLELREEMMVIVMAGTDTSAVASSYAAVILSRYPDAQEKVYKELKEIFGDSDRDLVVEDLPKLKYMEAVIKETLRLYPPVPVTGREVKGDVKLPSGTTLVDGVTVILDTWAIHRNPKYWGKDADQFRPERFLEGPLKHIAQFQPFSYSIRNCLGVNYAMMSMKTLLANMLRRYEILPPSNMNKTELKEPLKVSYDVTMRHADNYMIRLIERSKIH